MCYIDTIIQVVGVCVSLVACLYTIKTYLKSSSILEVIESERRYEWNKKELENLFGVLSFDSMDSFFESPDYISNELWEGLRAIDLRTFQFDGKEKDTIVSFLNELDSFKDLNYKQTPSSHWKFQPIGERERFDAEKERQRMNYLFVKARALKPLYEKVKRIFAEYHINLRDINRSADDFYLKRKEEMDKIWNT